MWNEIEQCALRSSMLYLQSVTTEDQSGLSTEKGIQRYIGIILRVKLIQASHKAVCIYDLITSRRNQSLRIPDDHHTERNEHGGGR